VKRVLHQRKREYRHTPRLAPHRDQHSSPKCEIEGRYVPHVVVVLRAERADLVVEEPGCEPEKQAEDELADGEGDEEWTHDRIIAPRHGYSQLMAEEALLEQVLGAAAGSARMAAVATEDMIGARRHPDDWLDAWDPAYIRTTLPALRAMSKLYFRAEVRGLSNIPAEGPILLVGNHSGGTLIADTFVFAQGFYDHFGPLRRFHQLAHDLVFKIPGARARQAGRRAPGAGSGLKRTAALKQVTVLD
jgi:hypothetical protein